MVGKMTGRMVVPAARIDGGLRVPGDKSVAHRALLLAAIAAGESAIEDLPAGQDVVATRACLRALGVSITGDRECTVVRGQGLPAWSAPSAPLDCRNSGTTMRLLAGLLAGSALRATLTGDDSLRRRPMARVVGPLRRMGARIQSPNGCAPLDVEGGPLQANAHRLDQPSAQVKSAILLAGLHASGRTTVREPVDTRDHTERMLLTMGARLERADAEVAIQGGVQLRPLQIRVPGDLSSAAFLLAAAALRRGGRVTVREVGLNPTRTAFLDLLGRMGADVQWRVHEPDAVEPAGEVTVIGRSLTSVELGPADAARAIDEIPVLMALATQADGTTVIAGAGDLRQKESDRLRVMSRALTSMGARLDVSDPERIIIEGPTRLRGANVDPEGDHRMAMALATAALVADGPTTIEGADCVAVSYPEFFAHLGAISHD